MKVLLLRHSLTAGNLLKRYIGRTDEPLCPEGIALAESFNPRFSPDRLIVSPMLRCKQTAQILFPGVRQEVSDGLRECDFGAFENLNYKELSGNADYQAWIDSGGTLPFPGGESRASFSERCRETFAELLQASQKMGTENLAFVVHGGTIMAVMEGFASPHRDYYDWNPKNCGGYLCSLAFTKEGRPNLNPCIEVSP